MRVVVTRPLTVTTTTGKKVTVSVGSEADATFAGLTTSANGAMYRLSGSFGIRSWPGFEPVVRVDQLHRATVHADDLHRFCGRCNFTGRLGDQLTASGRLCDACSGTGKAKTYPANLTS